MRLMALKAVRACVESGDKSLDLSSLRLTEIPDNLPQHIEELDISSNEFKEFPGNLPPELKCLRAERNQLKHLPDIPPSLERLQACGNRLTALPRLPQTLSLLKVTNNQIRSLPPLPDNLRTLAVCGNKLSGLPDPLPPGLEHLHANYNRLKYLTEWLPDSLQSLHVDSNALKALPTRMPVNLKQIYADKNEITELPRELPPALEELSVNLNRIRHVPDSWPPNLKRAWFASNRITDIPLRLASARHPQAITLDFTDNPLGPESTARLTELPRAARSNDMAQQAAPGLIDALGKWFEPKLHGIVCAAWAGIADEPHAGQFAHFLNRLHESANTCGSKFSTEVSNWLLLLSKAPTIRKTVFLIAYEAGETCEDRAALALCSMWTAGALCKLEMGILDQNIPKFVDQARKIFRSEKLADMARERVALMRRLSGSSEIDEISIYLTYQAKLHDDLRLLSPVNNMRFFSSYYVREEELPDARLSVMEDENRQFPEWLSCWSPWEGMLKRLDSKGYDAMRETLFRTLEQKFEDKVTSFLRREGFPNDEETRQAAAPHVSKSIEGSVKQWYTRDFLRGRGQQDLLNPFWTEAAQRGVNPGGAAAISDRMERVAYWAALFKLHRA
jgi:Leucine-rich repeat (LRR) protein